MINNVNIVAIDDQQEQLTAIQNAFFSGGISCLPIHYQYDLMGNKSGIDHVDVTNFKPRVVVSDLNLRNGSLGNPMELVTPIANLLQKLAIEGPYLLIFWSGVTEQVERVMELLQERFSDQVTLPLHYSCINKDQYLQNADTTALKNKVRELINESSLLNALLDWESRVSLSARNTTNSLFQLTKPTPLAAGDNYQTLHTEKLQTVLATIGNETLGVKNANEEPEVALDLGLAPVLHDHLQSLSESQDRSVWRDAVPNIGSRLEPEQEIKAHLNSFYHVEPLLEASSKSKRGTWVQFSPEYLNNPSNATKIKARLGKEIKTILHEEFLDSSQGTKAERTLARNDTQIGFIELSAECDQAQRKTKLHKYLLSVMIPTKHSRFTQFGEGTRAAAHSGIYRLPNLIIDGEEYIVKVTFMYQIGAIPDTHKWLGSPKFRLKDQVLADIAYQCSLHASRPGIIRFD